MIFISPLQGLKFFGAIYPGFHPGQVNYVLSGHKGNLILKGYNSLAQDAFLGKICKIIGAL